MKMKKTLFVILPVLAVCAACLPLYAAPENAAEARKAAEAKRNAENKARAEMKRLNSEMKDLLKKNKMTEADAAAGKILALNLDGSRYQTVLQAFCAKKMYGADYTRKYYERAMADKSLSLYYRLVCRHLYGALLMETDPDAKEAGKLFYAPFTDPGLSLKERSGAFVVMKNALGQKSFSDEQDKAYRMYLDLIRKDKKAPERDRENAISQLVSWRLGLLRYSPETTRAYCAELLKDPFYASCRLTLLCADASSYIGRAEAVSAADALEKEIRSDMSAQEKRRIYSTMLTLYTDGAKRYYLPDDPAVLKKKLKALRKFVEVSPADARAYVDIVQTSNEIGDTGTAEAALEKLEKWNSGGMTMNQAHAAAFAFRAEKAYSAGDYAKASNLCDQALAAANPAHFYGEAKLLEMAVRSAAALRKYDKALSYEPRVKKVARQSRRLLDEMNVLKNRLDSTEK